MSSWVDVAAWAEVGAAGMLEVEAGRAAVLLYDVAGAVYATSAICPHHAAWFSQGGMDGEFVNCPRHQGRFHIPTGRQVRGPECPALRTYPARVVNGRVEIAMVEEQ